MQKLLKLDGIGKSFAGISVLKDVSLDLAAGEVHVLAGENGAGKSTLIKIMAGVHSQYEGQIELRGVPVRFKSPQDAQRLGVSVIYQELSLIDTLSVAENIFLGREGVRRLSLGQWLTPGESERRARQLCRDVGLDIDVCRKVEEFSLPVKNSIEIAKALSMDHAADHSRILILDEPTSALNAPEVERLFDLIGALKQKGYGLIYISHKMEEIYRLADRITVLRDGAWVGTAKAVELPEKELIRWMIGREMKEQFPPRIRPLQPQAPEKLRVRNLTAEKFRNVSLHVSAGEVLGIAGLQGSGNSEVLHAVFGSDEDDGKGEVVLNGARHDQRSPVRSIGNGLAFLTHDRKATGLVLNLGIRENLTLASLGRSSRAGCLLRSREVERAKAQAERLSIRGESLEQETGTLSGGNQQKVALGKWLETQPEVLLLDEPTRGVDVGAKHEIYRLIRELCDEGKAIVMISSEMPELLALSDRILVMHRGEISGEFSAAEATQEKVLEAAMGRGSVP